MLGLFLHEISHRLKTELSLPRDQHKAPGVLSCKCILLCLYITCTYTATGGSEDSGRKGKVPISVKVEPTDERTVSPPSPPDHHLLEPMDTSTQVKPERSLSDLVDKFCVECLSRGVYSLSDITSKLRGHQVSPPSALAPITDCLHSREHWRLDIL